MRLVRTVTRPDQWTLQLGRELPLEKFAVDDGRGTEVYVSPAKATVVLATTARTRAFAWIATIPHWFYFTSLRTNQRLWTRTVVWSAELGCVLAALGLVLGVVQFRKSTPFRLSKSIRYQGWMRWHYILGAVFGVFALTWVFSGLLSMEPFEWTNAEGLRIRPSAFTGGPLDVSRFGPFDAAAWATLRAGRSLKEIELRRIQDQPYYVARYASAPPSDAKRERLHQPYAIAGRAQPESELIDAATLAPRREPFSVESLLGRLKAAAPGTAIAAQDLLDDYDSYYYSRNREAPLPVLRVKFADPLETWVYVDPKESELLATVHRLNRVERWLYNGLHSLDFAFWYSKRPLWDIGDDPSLRGGAHVQRDRPVPRGESSRARHRAARARRGAELTSGSVLVAAGIFLSRIAGLVRERVIATYFGTGLHADVLGAGLRMPNVLQNLLGEGTLSASFIPVYSELLGQGRTKEAGRVAGAMFGTVALCRGRDRAARHLARAAARDVFLPGFAGQRRELMIAIVRILFPMTGVLVLSAWALGILNSHRHFFLPYFAPVLWNAAIIGALVAFAGRLELDALLMAAAWGGLAGGVLQFLVQLPAVLRLDREIRVSRGRDCRRSAKPCATRGPRSSGAASCSSPLTSISSSRACSRSAPSRACATRRRSTYCP